MENQVNTSIEARVYPLSEQRGNMLAFAFHCRRNLWIPPTRAMTPLRSVRALMSVPNVTIAGCFAVNGVKVMQGKNGLFASMPQMKMREAEGRLACEDRREAPPQPRTRRRTLTPTQRGKVRRRAVDSKGEWHDVCFPTTSEMRSAINHVVIGEYQRSRLNPTPERNNAPTPSRPLNDAR